MADITTTKTYKVMKERIPATADDWKIVAAEFPDEKLRDWFADWDNFTKVYDKICGYYSGDYNARWSKMFDLFPETAKIATATDEKACLTIDKWAEEKLGWMA